MGIDDSFIDSLLYEKEGVELDFKQNQYLFTNASDNDKSELLKDILAFANAWRRTDAFILIGVKEVKDGRNAVVGISDLLDDANLQEFVNKKTNRPITFSYRNTQFEGKTIAIIHIPLQQRPVYLNKAFGRLKSDCVYIRRGSSTDIAKLEEVSHMGAQQQPKPEEPALEVFFADPKTRSKLANKQSVHSLVLEMPEPSSIPDYSPRASFPLEFIVIPSNNQEYYREMTECIRVRQLAVPLYVCIYNSGSVTSNHVRLEIRIDTLEGNVVVIGSHDYPDMPQKDYLGRGVSRVRAINREYDIQVTNIGSSWILEAEAKKVQPSDTFWFPEPFYIGGYRSAELTLQTTLFADELHTPIKTQLFVDMQSEHRQVDLSALMKSLKAEE